MMNRFFRAAVVLFAGLNVLACSAGWPPDASYSRLDPDQYLTRWMILGPVPVADGVTVPTQDAQKASFDTDRGIPSNVPTPSDGQEAEIFDRTYRWRYYESASGPVILDSLFASSDFVFAYALAEINLDEPKDLVLGVQSDDAVKIWVNDREVHTHFVGRGLGDQDLVPVRLEKGRNRVVLRIQDMQGGWAFSVQVLGPKSLQDGLMTAARSGQLDEIDRLIGLGADPNARDASGLTALHVARLAGRTEAEQRLLAKGADGSIPMPAPEVLAEGIVKQALDEEAPGAAVLVAQNGKILFEKGYGLADLASKTPITTESQFRIGSITKQFTATAILKLVEAGKIKLDDPLSKYVPGFPRGDEVTIHHLLTHTSGIHSYTGRPDFLGRVTGEVKPDELVALIQTDPFDFDPGTAWSYNNSGFFLLGYIVEKVSGQSFDQFLKANLFQPLGMNHTGIHHRGVRLDHEAKGHAYENGKYIPALDWDMSWAGGAGALYSTVEDLYRWNEAVFSGKVLPRSYRDAAFTPVKLNDGRVADAMGGTYGYGWMMADIRGLQEIGHGGGLHGFISYLARYPEQNLTVVVLANAVPFNRMNSSAVARELAEVYLWKDMKPQASVAIDTTVDTSQYADYVGRYQYPGGAVLIVSHEGDRLLAQLTGQERFEIFPRDRDVFFWKVVDAQITFKRDANGRVTGGTHKQSGQEFDVPKLVEESAATIDPAVFDAYVGEYEMQPGVTVTMSREGEHFYTQITGQPRFELFPRSEGEYFLKAVEASITFARSADGRVEGLVIHQGGRDMPAKKVK